MTSVLDFARGPGLHWALIILVFGFFWRLANFVTRGSERDLYWARKGFHPPAQRWHLDSYAMHAGLIIATLGFVPHILLVRELTGISWPGLPIAVVLFAGVVTIVAMLSLLAYRFSAREPSAFSAFDDYFSWIVVFAAVVTGMLAYPHVGGAALTAPYRALLSAHLLSVELLFVWLPFGKLAHLALMPLGVAAVRGGRILRQFAGRKSAHT
ncbi:MAG: nitrate reductase [Candidatus Binataceae bacterium]